MTVYALGHSNRSIEDFLDLLTANAIDDLVDIRAHPGSRKYPWFNQDRLASALAGQGIGYLHCAGLGGRRRPAAASVNTAANTAWQNASFRAYADYMQTAEFAAALDGLVAITVGRRVAIMCTEAVPWRCHRRLVTDALLARGVRCST